MPGNNRPLNWPPSALPIARSNPIQLRRQFRSNHKTFIVDNQLAQQVDQFDLKDLFGSEISNFETANHVIGVGKLWNPTAEQTRWLFWALKFLVGNKDRLNGIDVKTATKSLFNAVCGGQIRMRAVDPSNERNFGREILRIIGYRQQYLAGSLAAPNRMELAPYYALDVEAPKEEPLDVKLLDERLETELIDLMKRHDPGYGESVQLTHDPLATAKAVHRFARDYFRPYIAAIVTLPVTLSQPIDQRLRSLDKEEFKDPLRISLLFNRAQGLPLLADAHFNTARVADHKNLEGRVALMLEKGGVRELVDRHLRVTPRTGHTQKFIALQSVFQKFKEQKVEEAVAAAQWQRIGSISHELMHFYCHHGFEAKQKTVQFGQVIIEGFTELLGAELYDKLRANVAMSGPLTDSLRGEAPVKEFVRLAQGASSKGGYEAATERARKIYQKVGKNNTWAAYFLGKAELVGL